MIKKDNPRADRPKPARHRPPVTPKPKADKPSAEMAAASAPPQRIAKAMARAGLCSRRDAETWIEQGRVSINGEVCETPAVTVGPADIVFVDGAALPSPEKTRLFLFHKPRGLVTSDRDPEGRATVIDFLRERWPEGPRVVTIGRLDINTEGLLLLTNDGGLARVLELPETGWVRRYRVRAKGETDQAQLDSLAGGISIDGVDYAGIEAKLDRTQSANCWLTMGLREGKNREIKRVLEHLGLEVNRLIRLSFGPFQLLDLAEGAVDEVSTRVLRDQLGEALAAKAGALFDVAEPTADVVRKASHAGPARRPSAPESMQRRERRQDRGPRVEPVEDRRPRQDRPAPGTRKHISALRAERAEPRTRATTSRIDRSQTVDRRDRVVQVERITGESRVEARGRHGNAAARADDRPRRGPRGNLSPSAVGKRERIARSGRHGAAQPTERAARPQRAEFPQNRPEARSGKPHATPSTLRSQKRPPAKRGDIERATAQKRANAPSRPPRAGAQADRSAGRSRKPHGTPDAARSQARPPRNRDDIERAATRKRTDAPSRPQKAGTRTDRSETRSRKPQGTPGTPRSQGRPPAKRGAKDRPMARTRPDGPSRPPKNPSDRRTRRPDPKR